jgi:hypothetical protein
VGILELDLQVFAFKQRIFVFTLFLQKLSICNSMLLMFFIVPFDPHVSGFLLTSNDLIEVLDLFIKLFLSQLKLSLDALLFNFKSFHIAFDVDHALFHIINFLLLLFNLVFFHLNDILGFFDAFMCLTKLDFSIVTDLVSNMQLLHGVLEFFVCQLKLL